MRVELGTWPAAEISAAARLSTNKRWHAGEPPAPPHGRREGRRCKPQSASGGEAAHGASANSGNSWRPSLAFQAAGAVQSSPASVKPMHSSRRLQMYRYNKQPIKQWRAARLAANSCVGLISRWLASNRRAQPVMETEAICDDAARVCLAVKHRPGEAPACGALSGGYRPPGSSRIINIDQKGVIRGRK